MFPDCIEVNFIGLEARGNCALNFDDVYVGLKEAADAACAAVDVLVKNGICVSLYNFPLCFVKEGYWNLCRNSITPEKIRFSRKCDECLVKAVCCGFFQTTLALAKPEVHPILFPER